MSDDLRAAEAFAALQGLDTARIEYKADITPAVLDIDNRDVTTLFSVDCLDTVGDITEVGAFKQTINRRGKNIAHLYMHELNEPPIARIMSFQPLSRAELPTDVQIEHPDATGGMACVSRYLKTGRGAEVYEGIKEGIPFQASFGYSVVRAEAKALPDGKKARVIKELLLYEVSTTPPGHAANSATRTRLGKAQAIIEELKAGWRHGKHGDIETINQMVAMLIGMGATNAQLIDAAPPLHAARPSNALDDIIADIEAVIA
jgi:HK97 family phage prohead protease